MRWMDGDEVAECAGNPAVCRRSMAFDGRLVRWHAPYSIVGN